MKNISISLVVPAYNEESIIAESADIFCRKLSGITNDFEIIFVNDASKDRTGAILDSFCSSNHKVRLINNDKNCGSGASLWRGFKEARKELVLSNFADRPFDLDDLEPILPLLDDNKIDFVVVARKDRSANSFYRKLTSYVNLLAIKILFNLKIRDFQFVQIYRKKILDGINVVSTGTFVPPEIMIKLLAKGHKYKEAECKFHKRPQGFSKCGDAATIIKTLKEMFAFWFNNRCLK